VTEADTDHDRLYRYAEAFFQRSDRTEFPTVRTAARSLRWTHARVIAAVEGDPDSRMFTSSYGLGSTPEGDLFVETS